MKFFIAAATLLMAGTISFAQFAPEPRYDPPTVSALIDQVHADLNHMYEAKHVSGDRRDRLNHAEKELREFAAKWDHGKFDKGQLNDAIDSIQHVLDENKMKREDRSAVDADLAQMRDMRTAYERHEIDGVRH